MVMVVCGGLWDHPRSRGVYGQAHRSITSLSGSSPLARGLLLHLRAQQSRSRIIPARAGFTFPGHPRLAARVDHPRSRGVYCAFAVIFTTSVGSSPLARGLLSVWCGQARR